MLLSFICFVFRRYIKFKCPQIFIFRLSVGQPECSTKRIEITHNDLMSGADNLDSVLALSPSGYLLWSDEGSVHQVSSKDFCIDQYK